MSHGPVDDGRVLLLEGLRGRQSLVLLTCWREGQVCLYLIDLISGRLRLIVTKEALQATADGACKVISGPY